MKTEFLERAKEFFSKNEGVSKVYFTSDGNMFRAEHYAEDWKNSLPDKAVTPITRADANGEVSPADTQSENGSSQTDTGSGDAFKAPVTQPNEADAKKALTLRYIELFDKKPVAMNAEQIAKKIADKEAEPKA